MSELNFNAKNIEKAIQNIQRSSFDEAIKLLENNIKNNAEDFRSYYVLGTLYLQLRKLDLAEVNLKKALNIKQDLFEASHNLGLVFNFKKNFDEAKNLFFQVLKIRPNNIQTLIELGKNYEIAKNFSEARKYYERILDIDKNNRLANSLIGNMLINTGYHNDGLKYLKKATGLIRFNENDYQILK